MTVLTKVPLQTVWGLPCSVSREFRPQQDYDPYTQSYIAREVGDLIVTLRFTDLTNDEWKRFDLFTPSVGMLTRLDGLKLPRAGKVLSRCTSVPLGGWPKVVEVTVVVSDVTRDDLRRGK